jgi:Flp pilus assembly protein TadB
MAIPCTTIAFALCFTSLLSVFVAWLAAILLGYCLIVWLVKTCYVRRYDYSLCEADLCHDGLAGLLVAGQLSQVRE